MAPLTPTVRGAALRLSFAALLLAAAGMGAPAPVAAQDDLAGQVDAWYRTAQRAAPGDWGIAIADQQGRTLWERRADELFVPASTVKLFTTGFARAVLGGEARRETRVVGTGRLEPGTGVWLGPWALEMNGDPSLGRRDGRGHGLAMSRKSLPEILTPRQLAAPQPTSEFDLQQLGQDRRNLAWPHPLEVDLDPWRLFCVPRLFKAPDNRVADRLIFGRVGHTKTRAAGSRKGHQADLSRIQNIA